MSAARGDRCAAIPRRENYDPAKVPRASGAMYRKGSLEMGSAWRPSYYIPMPAQSLAKTSGDFARCGLVVGETPLMKSPVSSFLLSAALLLVASPALVQAANDKIGLHPRKRAAAGAKPQHRM